MYQRKALTHAQNVGGSSTAAIEEILSDVDKDGDGRIDYEEFCSMMRKGNTEAAINEAQAKKPARKGAF